MTEQHRRNRNPGLIDPNARGFAPVIRVSVSSAHVAAGDVIDKNHTIGVGTNRLLIVAVSSTDYSPPAVTCDGVSMAQFGTMVHAASTPSVSLWYKVNPDSGTRLISTNTSSTNDYTAIGIVDYIHVNQNTPLSSFIGNTETDGSPTINLTGALYSLAFGFIGYWASGAIVVPDASLTELYAENIDGGWRSEGVEKAGATSVVLSWTLPAFEYTCAIGAIINKQ
jgi:hypothetical protein